MLVSELRELLATMPETAPVAIRIEQNISFDGTMRSLGDDPREAEPIEVEYSYGRVVIRLNEEG